MTRKTENAARAAILRLQEPVDVLKNSRLSEGMLLEAIHLALDGVDLMRSAIRPPVISKGVLSNDD